MDITGYFAWTIFLMALAWGGFCAIKLWPEVKACCADGSRSKLNLSLYGVGFISASWVLISGITF